MPEIGEIKKGSEVGYRNSPNKLTWHACVDCGKERWVPLYRGKPRALRCRHCACASGVRTGNCREKHYKWKGGVKHDKGYILIRLLPSDFYYPMAEKSGYVMEHRLVMAKKLGRCLQTWEIVHHKGIRFTGIENRSDNLEDNLEMSNSIGEHSRNHSKGYKDGYAKGLIDGRTKQIDELKQEIKLLQWQVKQMQGVIR